jgi:hypothetical protein
MYATRLLNRIYHLVPPSAYHTLCGLRVSRVPVGTKQPGNLQLVEKVPPSKIICKHCDRISNRPYDQSGDLVVAVRRH